MAYLLRYHAAAVEDFAEIPLAMVARIRRAVETRLATAPFEYGERLRDDLSGLWKIRVGDYRVVYEADEKTRLVSIWGVAHRKGVYPAMVKRWLRRKGRK